MSRSRWNFAGRPSRALAGMVCALATANPGCLLRLRLGARRHGLRVPVAHLIQLLAGAYE